MKNPMIEAKTKIFRLTRRYCPYIPGINIMAKKAGSILTNSGKGVKLLCIYYLMKGDYYDEAKSRSHLGPLLFDSTPCSLGAVPDT